MFSDDFNPKAVLTTETCPRCHTVGLAVPDAETCARTTAADWFEGGYDIRPSITAWCPACGVMGDWPGMCWEPEEKPQRKRKGLSKIA
jgi:hypothetical protein